MFLEHMKNINIHKCTILIPIYLLDIKLFAIVNIVTATTVRMGYADRLNIIFVSARPTEYRDIM